MSRLNDSSQDKRQYIPWHQYWVADLMRRMPEMTPELEARIRKAQARINGEREDKP